MTVPPLVGLQEVAAILGASKQYAGQLADRPSFPRPVATLARGRIWLESEVREWQERRRAGLEKAAG